jgi:hypothetical protein
MLNKDDRTNKSVKVCNHKPGDPWEEEGCCKSQKSADQFQENQIVNEETEEPTQQTEDEDKFTRMLF